LALSWLDPFEGVADALDAVARDGPLLLVLDDL
jgi:hypothetical protein